jgi:hypothetical protein
MKAAISVAALHELDLAARPLQDGEDAIDTVGGIIEDPPDAPSMKPFDEEVADRLRDEPSFSRVRQPIRQRQRLSG